MKYHNVMRIIEIFCQNGDVQAIQPVCAEDCFILQVSPEHSVLQEMHRISDLALLKSNSSWIILQ